MKDHLTTNRVDGVWLIPGCSCGWTGERSAARRVAHERQAQHLADVGAPALAPYRSGDADRWARDHLGVSA